MVDNEIAVSVQNIHKNFILPMNKSTSLKQLAVNMVKKNRKVEQHVLDDISFDIYKGDFFGIIGRNGSGKSTLLKLLAGVYTPTSGTITINGGLTPFIELGVGFNPELSGRDNIYLNCALLGFTRKRVDAMYAEIVSFAELEPFMGQKLKNYSSGMQVRLAFSIAIKAKNDILIFDEVLAVGDEAFQRKCLAVFEKYKASKQTVILVTHDMETVRRFCNNAILLKDGKIVASGDPRLVANEYSDLNNEVAEKEARQKDEKQNHSKDIFSVVVTDTKDNKKFVFKHGDSVRIGTILKNVGTKNIESVGITLIKQSGEHLGGVNSRVFAAKWNKRDPLYADIALNFSPGVYTPLIEVFSEPGKRIATQKATDILVVSKKPLNWSGLTELGVDWNKGRHP